MLKFGGFGPAFHDDPSPFNISQVIYLIEDSCKQKNCEQGDYCGGNGIKIRNPWWRIARAVPCLGGVFWATFLAVNDLLLYDRWYAVIRFRCFLLFFEVAFLFGIFVFASGQLCQLRLTLPPQNVSLSELL